MLNKEEKQRNDLGPLPSCPPIEKDEEMVRKEKIELNKEATTNARLIASAPDHALFLSALAADVAWYNEDALGYLIVTEDLGETLQKFLPKLDESGCPILTNEIRDALRKAMKQ